MSPGLRILPCGDEAARSAALEAARAALLAGGAAVYPTETFYALGADPRSERGRSLVFRLKARDPGKPLPWIAADREQAAAACEFPPAAEALARRYWPGPLTLVLPLRGGAGSAAVRVSPHPLARALAAGIGHPVISTSANCSGEPPARTAAEAAAGLAPAVPEGSPIPVLDGGTTPGGAPSVILDLTGPTPRAIRGSLDSLPPAS